MTRTPGEWLKSDNGHGLFVNLAAVRDGLDGFLQATTIYGFAGDTTVLSGFTMGKKANGDDGALPSTGAEQPG